VIDPQREETFFIKGDRPDPAGGGSMGTEVGMNMTGSAVCHPMIRYRDRIIESDVYHVDGQLLVHIICPVCEEGNYIRAAKKRIILSGDVLDVERFRCGWCAWEVEIRRNLAVDARGGAPCM